MFLRGKLILLFLFVLEQISRNRGSSFSVCSLFKCEYILLYCIFICCCALFFMLQICQVKNLESFLNSKNKGNPLKHTNRYMLLQEANFFTYVVMHVWTIPSIPTEIVDLIFRYNRQCIHPFLEFQYWYCLIKIRLVIYIAATKLHSYFILSNRILLSVKLHKRDLLCFVVSFIFSQHFLVLQQIKGFTFEFTVTDKTNGSLFKIMVAIS